MRLSLPSRLRELDNALQLVACLVGLVAVIGLVLTFSLYRESASWSTFESVPLDNVTDSTCSASMTTISGDVGNSSAVLNATLFPTSVGLPPSINYTGLHLWSPYTLGSKTELYNVIIRAELHSIEMVALNNQIAMLKVQWLFDSGGAVQPPSFIMYSAQFASLAPAWVASQQNISHTPVFIFHRILKLHYRGLECGATWFEMDDGSVLFENGCLADRVVFSRQRTARNIANFVATDKEWGQIACQTFYTKHLMTPQYKLAVQAASGCLASLTLISLIYMLVVNFGSVSNDLFVPIIVRRAQRGFWFSSSQHIGAVMICVADV